MARSVWPYAWLGFVTLLSGCSVMEPRAERPAWRNQAENACLARHEVKASQYLRASSEINGPGICGLQHPFKVAALADGTVMLNTDQTLGCPMLPALDAWIAQVVQPVAQARFGQAVIGISSMGSYTCRPIDNQRGNKLSEHSFGNAMDIGGFRLADGREISIVKEWKGGDDQTKAFLREVHAGACQFFTTVLGPGADVFHYNHIHVDLAAHGNTSTGPRRYCKPVPQNQLAPPRLDDLPDPPMIEEELDVAQASPRTPQLGVPPMMVATHRTDVPRAPAALALVARPGGPQLDLPPLPPSFQRPGVPRPAVPLAIASRPAAAPLSLQPRQPTQPKAGSMGDDGVFVPEGNPDEWDITSVIEGRKK